MENDTDTDTLTFDAWETLAGATKRLLDSCELSEVLAGGVSVSSFRSFNIAMLTKEVGFAAHLDSGNRLVPSYSAIHSIEDLVDIGLHIRAALKAMREARELAH